MKWVNTNMLSKKSGYTSKAIYNKISRGDWLEGIHWRRAPDRRLFFDLAAIENWIEGKIA